jgi:predicted tellurium resistance membrane protein TerC
VKPIHRVRVLSVGLSKAVVTRFTATVILATFVALGTGGCLLVPWPVPVGGGGHHHHR